MDQENVKQQLKMLLRESFRAGAELSRRGWRRVQQMSGAQMLACALLLVVAIAILHLALFLFIVFSIFKIIVLASVWVGRKNSQHDASRRKPQDAPEILPPRLLK